MAPQHPGEPRKVLSLGEAKWGKRLGGRHLARLGRARDILAQQGCDTHDTVLALYGAKGFDPALPRDRHVRTFGLTELYRR